MSAYAEQRPLARFVEDGRMWDVPCEIALPWAAQNELDVDAARQLIDNGVIAVSKGAREHALHSRGHPPAGGKDLLFAPGKEANVGGVATSALEMQQNVSRDS